MYIIGAGLSGLLAAKAFPKATVLDASKKPQQQHKALLRFRTDKVSQLTGIPFRKVKVRKGVWSDGRYVSPTINLANEYAYKCTGRLVGERSIWNLDPVERYIAPDDFYQQLIDDTNVLWDHPYDANLHNDKSETPVVISTMPMPSMLDIVGYPRTCDFHRSGIKVCRARIPGCDLFQTVYFPDPDTTLYRASITGQTLICEFVGEPDEAWLGDVIMAFGLPASSITDWEEVHQRYGKIVDIPATVRNGIIHRLSLEHNIFSVGRFATWRNILLDDVVDDLEKVRGLIKMSNYERQLELLK